MGGVHAQKLIGSFLNGPVRAFDVGFDAVFVASKVGAIVAISP